MKRKLINAASAIISVLIAAALLGKSAGVSAGMRSALSLCENTLVPALFPFMVLCGFISRSGCGDLLARPFGRLWRRVFKIPEEAGVAVMLGMIGGYPVGAKTIASLLERGIIDDETAERMLCFCVNSGPPFLLTAVGAGLLLDKTAGIILLVTQTAASLIIGIVVSVGKKAPKRSCVLAESESAGVALVSAVSGAASSMLLICSFAVLFSGLLAVIEPSVATGLSGMAKSILPTMLSGFFEVTSGCVSAATLGGEAAFVLTSSCVSFGGLSVIFQVASCFTAGRLRLAQFIFSRLIHIPLACVMALPLWRHFCQTASATLILPPVAQSTERGWLGTACLMGMCTILLLGLRQAEELQNHGFWDKIKQRIQKRGAAWK